MSIQDGSVEWQKDFMMGLRKLPLVVGYNKKQTFTSSGSFTPTMTGLYRLELVGGGGGGSGATKWGSGNGGGGITNGVADLRSGSSGSNGYITFEWFDPSEAFPDIGNVLEPSE